MVTAEGVSAAAAVLGVLVSLGVAFFSARNRGVGARSQRVMKYQKACRMLDDPQVHPLVKSRVCTELVDGKAVSESGVRLLVSLGDSRLLDLYSKTGDHVQLNADGTKFVFGSCLKLRAARLLLCIVCFLGSIITACVGIVPLALSVDGHMEKQVQWFTLSLVNVAMGLACYLMFVKFLQLAMADAFFQKMRALGLADDGAVGRGTTLGVVKRVLRGMGKLKGSRTVGVLRKRMGAASDAAPKINQESSV